MITPISPNKIFCNKNRIYSAQNKSNVSFCARAEFELLSDVYYRPLSSGFFRRGAHNKQKKSFKHVINAIHKNI